MAKLRPKMAKMRPKMAKMRPKMAKMRPKMAKTRPKVRTGAKVWRVRRQGRTPKMAQTRPKTSKTRPKARSGNLIKKKNTDRASALWSASSTHPVRIIRISRRFWSQVGLKSSPSWRDIQPSRAASSSHPIDFAAKSGPSRGQVGSKSSQDRIERDLKNRHFAWEGCKKSGLWGRARAHRERTRQLRSTAWEEDQTRRSTGLGLECSRNGTRMFGVGSAAEAGPG